MRRALATLFVLAMACASRAERLPVRAYTTADGLAQDDVERIVQDSRGYIWFCTPEGLSRFDGYSFTSYDDRDGLTGRRVHDVLETRDGRHLVASSHGLFVLESVPAAPRRNPSSPAFVLLTPGRHDIHSLHEAADGTIWCGLSDGVARLVHSAESWNLERVALPAPLKPGESQRVDSFLAGADGLTWLATSDGVFLGDARGFERVDMPGIPAGGARQLLHARDGALWAALDEGLAVIAPSATQWHLVELGGGTSPAAATCLLESMDGTLWVGTFAGLLEKAPGARGFRRHGISDGLTDDTIFDLIEDAAGTIWAGTESGGALRLSRHGFVTYDAADGLGHSRISQVLETDQGELVAVDSRGSLNVFDGQRFDAVQPNLTPTPRRRSWGWHQFVLEDREGEWWIPTGDGLYVFDRVPRVASLAIAYPKHRYTTADGLGSDEVFRIFEDAAGTIWVGTFSAESRVLSRFDRAAGSFVDVVLLPGKASQVPTAFCEDDEGHLWIGLYDGTVLRTVAGADAQVIVKPELEASTVRDLLFDSRGRLWVALDRGGLLQVTGPNSGKPSITTWSPARGLASWNVSCVVEADAGRMWVGTARGLSRLDPSTGAVDRFTIADGLGNSYVNVAHRDASGSFWFGTLRGLSRLSPMADRDAPPPRAWIRRLDVGGRPWRIPELGTDDIHGVIVEASARRLDVEFGAVSLTPGGEPRYQWKLEGADSDWSLPSAQRSVTYDHLATGKSRFLVRAIDGRGRAHDPAAQISIVVKRPLWQQWWFVLLVVAALGGLGGLLYSSRVDQLLELERVRTRIASDLHDDIGAGLTQVAILSEVARQRAQGAPPQVLETLERVALVSRELVDSMSDIVWAVDPRRDELSDLVHRMRRFASDVFTAKDVEFAFETRLGAEALKVPADLRRQVFLIYKEAVNNAARHSGCSKATVKLVQEGYQLVLTIEDDGVGFELSDEITGLGLGSLVTRARKLGGVFDVRSAEGEGTLVTLSVPLRRRTR